MSINFRPLTKHDVNFSRAIDLYKEAFPDIQRIPPWILQYKVGKGKAGSSIIYDHDTWVGFIYITEYKDIVFIQFFAISESCRSAGYGSKVIDSIRNQYFEKRIVLNIEELDEHADNNHQRIKRKAFYEKNGFSSSGYLVKEPGEQLEMLILGGSISKEEIEAMYKHLFGYILSFFFRPEVIKI